MTGKGYMPPPVRHDWQTPDCVLERVRKVGEIYLDPCTSADNPTGAMKFYTEADDGLSRSWKHKHRKKVTFVNPPYGRSLGVWSDKIIDEHMNGTSIIALVPSRTDTKWFTRMVTVASDIGFIRGRLTFKGATAPAPFPSVLFYFGGPNGGAAFQCAFQDMCWFREKGGSE